MPGSPEFRPDHGASPRCVVEARRRSVQHACERSHGGEAARIEEAAQLLFAVSEIDEQRTFELVERASEERRCYRLVIRNQRTHLRGPGAVAAQREPPDATRALGNAPARGQ